MLAFELQLNGKKICTAGIGEPGVLTSFITWVLGDGGSRQKGREEMFVRLGGLVSRTNQHLDWLRRPLRRGDEVSIRVVEVDVVDTPKRQRRESPTHQRRAQERYVRRMAKQFGWKIETR